ncbi:MAG: hypothetical protein JSW25_00100 [Thermoplasmata archaeon]|nr:MAG: hypothetical protein JSW25_00100 [Thermoplasmata archaeon]
MVAWELVIVLASLFFWGLARGTTICLSVCVPGLLPYLAEKPRGPWDGARFGALLCLPRLLIFTLIGIAWGAISYAIFRSAAFEDAAVWMYVIGYTALGAIIVVVGLGMFIKAAKDKEELRQAKLRAAEAPDGIDPEAPSVTSADEAMAECDGPVDKPSHRAARSITGWLLRFVPGSDRSERTFVLLWGSILGFTCLLEVSILEVAILGGAAANLAQGTFYAAMAGGAAMFLFALGASIPIIISAAAFAAYIDRVETQERLISLRVTGSLVMVMIGGLLVYRYLILLANLLASGEI